MNLSFTEILPSGLRKRIEYSDVFVEHGGGFGRNPVADVTFVLIKEDTVTCDGTTKAAVDMNCSRCRQSVIFKLDAEYKYIFKLGSDSALLKRTWSTAQRIVTLST